MVFRRALRSWEKEDEGKLLQMIQSAGAVEEFKNDKVNWVAGSTEVFSVKSVYDWRVSISSENFEFSKIVWNKYAPPRVQFFGWCHAPNLVIRVVRGLVKLIHIKLLIDFS